MMMTRCLRTAQLQQSWGRGRQVHCDGASVPDKASDPEPDVRTPCFCVLPRLHHHHTVIFPDARMLHNFLMPECCITFISIV